MTEIALFPVTNDKNSISSVAHTVSLAFSPDPLIQWLRPNASTPETWKWQYRRVQRVMLKGLAFKSTPVKHIAQIFPAIINGCSGNDAVVEKINSTLEAISGAAGLDAGTVVFLYSPKEDWEWTTRKLYRACQLWILDWLSPIPDTGASKERHKKRLKAHEASVNLLKLKYHLKHLWYLEVVAVHPLLQSRGLGRNVLEWILKYTGNDPIFLECARRENIGLYESHGFEVVEEVELVDEEDAGLNQQVQYWVMVRR